MHRGQCDGAPAALEDGEPGRQEICPLFSQPRKNRKNGSVPFFGPLPGRAGRKPWSVPVLGADTRPGAQLVLFLVLVVVVALPAYTSAPQRWAGIGVVLWAAVVLLLSFRPRGLGR